MAGYTRKDPCLGKLDDIHAHGVLIEQDSGELANKHLLLVSMDLLKVPLSLANYMKERLSKQFNSLQKENILIHATHTHSAPDLTGEFHWPGGTLNVMKGILFGANRNDKYLIWLSRRIIKLVKSLFKTLEPCKIAWKKEIFNPNLVINRRHPTRGVTPDLGVTCFKNIKDNKMIGIIVHYACHPTTLSFANNKLSADYPGRLTHRIEELSNGKTPSIFFNGPAGDLNPITTCGTNFEDLEKDKSKIYGQLGTYKDTVRIGNQIAEEAWKLAQFLPENAYFDHFEFKSSIKEIKIPLKDARYFSHAWYGNKGYFILKKVLLLPIARQIETNFPAFYIKHDFLHTWAETILQYIECKAWLKEKENSKNFSIFTVPGELFESIGKNLLKKSPNKRENSFLFQNSNDWIAYLFPIMEYMNVGGYEPVASFSPMSGEVVEKEMISLFSKVEK